MTTRAQEILEGITRHRGNRVATHHSAAFDSDLIRKIDEIEWALQALAELLRDQTPADGENK